MSFRNQLAAVVKYTKWSYAIFWSISEEHPELLSWSDGCYNGEIRTRKTTHPLELPVDRIGFERSEHLRDLYLSLLAGDTTSSQTAVRRTSALLSPEDLTETEWYYLVCMSFTFNIGQGLPGEAFASNKHIWCSNGNYSNNRTFSRSLLAKTVACFPFMGGVLELGNNDLVHEDPSLIQQITDSFWKSPSPLPSPVLGDEENLLHTQIIHDLLNLEGGGEGAEDLQSPLDEDFLSFLLNSSIPAGEIDGVNGNLCEQLCLDSPEDGSLEGQPRCQDPHRVEVNSPLNWSDCISQSPSPSPLYDEGVNRRRAVDFQQQVNYDSAVAMDLPQDEGDDSHYMKTLCRILGKNSRELLLPHKRLTSLPSCQESSFRVWEKSMRIMIPNTKTPQRVLKGAVVNFARRNAEVVRKNCSSFGNKFQKLEGDDCSASHVLSERRRREKLNEKFVVLRSLIPSISKTDKASILSDTIEYVKNLERRVAELESCGEQQLSEPMKRRKKGDRARKPEDSFADTAVSCGRRTVGNKMKACQGEEAGGSEHHWLSSRDGPVDMNITIIDKEVIVEINCPWRESLVLEVIETMSSLDLDVHSTQSTTVCGVVGLSIKAKLKGLAAATPGLITQALHRIVGGV